MSDLRGGSTVGGRPIATTDMLEKIISQEQIQDWTSKMNMYEKVSLTTVANIDLIAKDKTKNGIYQVDNIAPSTGMYSYGGIFNAIGTGYGFQIYSPEKDSSSGTSSAMYFRTRSSNTLRPWERIATYSYVDSRDNLKFDKTGGTITGATTINSTLTTSGVIAANNLIKSTFNSNTVTIGSVNAGYCHFNNSANIPFHFNKDVKIAGEIYAGTAYDQKVWHAANFNPSSYMLKSTELAVSYDLNNAITEGHYRVSTAVNRPSKISNWAYLEVISHSTNWVLQKIYDFEGTVSYMRTKTNTGWRPWIPLGSGMSYVLPITVTTAWTTDSTSGSATNGLNYITVTHSLGSENIVSVVVTDSAKMSMLTGFEVIDGNRLKVWCGDKVTGKIVVNAIP